MATMGRHVGFRKLQTQYSGLELSKTYESTLSYLTWFISIIFSVRTSKKGDHFEKWWPS